MKHNEKLTIPTSSYYKKNHENKLKRLSLLKKYKQENLTSSQKITQKIAIFDTENDIYQYEKFRYHSYLFNQISGNHLNLIEFMTDTHPLKNYNDALSYIKRVKLFGDILSANLEWLKEQKKEEIYPPKFVFDHVIELIIIAKFSILLASIICININIFFCKIHCINSKAFLSCKNFNIKINIFIFHVLGCFCFIITLM